MRSTCAEQMMQERPYEGKLRGVACPPQDSAPTECHQRSTSARPVLLAGTVAPMHQHCCLHQSSVQLAGKDALDGMFETGLD